MAHGVGILLRWPVGVDFRWPLNCALGATLMRPYIQELARAAQDTFISGYPNAGLPNPMRDTGLALQKPLFYKDAA